jgi:hypothetical protein
MQPEYESRVEYLLYSSLTLCGVWDCQSNPLGAREQIGESTAKRVNRKVLARVCLIDTNSGPNPWLFAQTATPVAKIFAIRVGSLRKDLRDIPLMPSQSLLPPKIWFSLWATPWENHLQFQWLKASQVSASYSDFEVRKVEAKLPQDCACVQWGCSWWVPGQSHIVMSQSCRAFRPSCTQSSHQILCWPLHHLHTRAGPALSWQMRGRLPIP